jgi:ABC-2 type transport system permease protein
MAIGTGVTFVWLFFAIAPVLAAGRYLGQGDGWTQARLLFLQAVWYWMDAVMWVFLHGNIRQLQSDVRRGELDWKLLLPTDSLTLVTLGKVNVPDLPKFAIAVGLGALPGSPWSVLMFVVCLLAASVLLWAVGVFSSYKVITKFEFEGDFLLSSAHNLARVPVSMYGTVLRIVLSSVLPVILITTVPSTVFFGWSGWQVPLTAIGATVALTAALRLAWRRETKLYVGLQG